MTTDPEPRRQRAKQGIAAVAVGLVLTYLVGWQLYQRAVAERRVRRVAALQAEIEDAYASGSWHRLLVVSTELSLLEPRNPDAWYDVACAQARLSEVDAAFDALNRSVAVGEMSSLHASRDTDLELLRGDPRFSQVLEGMRRNARQGKVEPGAPIAGVRMVDGYAEDGFRFRVRLSEGATPERPDGLLVWLHPSGAPFNEALEQYARELAERRWALLFPTFKQQWDAWYATEADMLLERTVPEAGRLPNLDAGRPVLVGYSAGGQALLSRWASDKPLPARGLVLVSAYPIVDTPAGRRLQALPDDEARRRIPMLALVGEADPGLAAWAEAEDDWRAAGVPLTVVRVPGAGHQWLVDAARLRLLLDWLERLPP